MITKTMDLIESLDLSVPIKSPKKTVQNALSKLLYKQHDKIYGLISISKIAKLITQHYIFARLKSIHQLGPLHFKFEHADHSRFEHSIGAAYLARYVGRALQRQHHEITDREILCMELAGLCHDLGHGAYSHSFDHLLHDLKFTHINAHHEMRSQVLFKYMMSDFDHMQNPKTHISIPEGMPKDMPRMPKGMPKGMPEDSSDQESKIDRQNYTPHTEFANKPINILSDEEVKLVQYFIDPERYIRHISNIIPMHFPGLEQIVNNQIHKVDVDKMDYLMRDAQALRFDQTLRSSLDILGLLKRTRIIDGIWMFNIRDQGIIYDLICRRFLFYTNRYLHPDVNAVSCMLTEALRIMDRVMHFSSSAKLETDEDVKMYCTLTDDYLLELILNSDDDKLSDAYSLIIRILTKKDWYEHIGDFVITNRNGPMSSIQFNNSDSFAPDELDDSSYCELPWEIFTDKSTPTNLLPKVRYHQNGIPVNPDNVRFVRRLYMKRSGE